VLLYVGFLSAGVQELPGNAGLFDMALALEWIKDYIKFFGGAPNKITIFGQGTGASSAILLSLSHITQGKTTTAFLEDITHILYVLMLSANKSVSGCFFQALKLGGFNLFVIISRGEGNATYIGKSHFHTIFS